ncbi:hypothetical protein [Actinoplanes sp. NPDC049265]|uniref:hypothetical protein n=1 Tax=Actinoplanes sp. NPDC049265 TaxID=3363902 RepID=UPI003711EEFE
MITVSLPCGRPRALRSDATNEPPRWAGPAGPDSTLGRQGLSRHGVLKPAGLFGAACGLGSAGAAEPAAAAPDDDPELCTNPVFVDLI